MNRWLRNEAEDLVVIMVSTVLQVIETDRVCRGLSCSGERAEHRRLKSSRVDGGPVRQYCASASALLTNPLLAATGKVKTVIDETRAAVARGEATFK